MEACKHVNKTFATTLANELANEGKMFLGIGTCSLHPVHTALWYQRIGF